MKNWLYQVFIHRMTNECYRGLLNHVARGSRVLDVGIGNGIMLEIFHPLIKYKNLRITGIDIDAGYLKHCRELIQRHELEEHIDLWEGPGQDYVACPEGCFDYVLFSMSFMLFPDPRAVLSRARTWLRPGGEVVFVQAMFRKRSRLVDLIKPKLKYLTTVDFGRAIYEKDFLSLLHDNELTIKEDRVLQGEWFNSQSRMIVASFQETHLSADHPQSSGYVPPRIRSTEAVVHRADTNFTVP